MVIETIAARYNQLYLEPTEEIFKSEQYTSIVKRGAKPEGIIGTMPDGFHGTADDQLFSLQTPAGLAEIVYLADRNDFERMIKILSRSAMPIPPTMGACTIFGIINWRKIENHKKEFLENGGTEFSWREEFASFTAVSSHYKDTLIITGKGGYSNITAVQAGYSEQEWLDYSLRIRTYHECTHVICRTLFPDKIDILRDEILADCIGLCAVFGRYDEQLARLFMGISADGLYTGGRLQNYVHNSADIPSAAEKVAEEITSFSRAVSGIPFSNKSNEQLFALISRLENI